jgi:hypothetical protein
MYRRQWPVADVDLLLVAVAAAKAAVACLETEQRIDRLRIFLSLLLLVIVCI